MSDRFFIETPLAQGAGTLSGPEAHHLAHVLRAKPGDVVALFDGKGKEADARVEKVERSSIELTIDTIREISREPVVEITLGAALPKGERQRWLVEKVVELGVRRLAPLKTQRSVSVPTASALARLERAVIEASKQCGRNRLMEIMPGQELDEFLESGQGQARWLAHPGGEPLPAAVQGIICGSSPPGTFYVAVGPEGGFTPDEITRAQAAGWKLVDLGPRILRVETACLYLAGALTLLQDDRFDPFA